MFSRRKIVYVSAEVFAEILERNSTKKFFLREYCREKGDFLQGRVYINDSDVKISMTLFENGGGVTYYTYKDDRNYIPSIAGFEAFRILSQYWQVPNVKKMGFKVPKTFSASPLIGYNGKYSGTRQTAWGYDLNSAYNWAMLNGWIDTTDYHSGNIEEGEIGFNYNEKGHLYIERQVGAYSMYIFKKMKTPEGIIRFVNRYYKMKKEAKNRQEKQKAKDVLTFSVGYLQNVNPFLRAWIVCQCNELIESLLDDECLFWNTDSIVSRVRRYDIEEKLGVECGEWKLEHEGVVAYIGNKYQWNNDVPVFRGVPKSAFPADYDILRDGTPHLDLIWQFDADELTLNYVGEGEKELWL